MITSLKEWLTGIGKKWGLFISIVIDPWTLVLLISITILYSFSIEDTGKADKTVSSILFILITFTSAILGGRITKHWVDVTEGGIVIARGKSAVRSLKLLLRSITALEQRVASFIAKPDEIDNHPEVTTRNYEEILGRCNLLSEETVSSIENWTDIVPEADIKTLIGVVSDLKQSIQEKENELERLNAELKDAKGKSKEELVNLKGNISEKEKQISKLERVLNRKIATEGLGTARSLKDYESISSSGSHNIGGTLFSNAFNSFYNDKEEYIYVDKNGSLKVKKSTAGSPIVDNK